MGAAYGLRLTIAGGDMKEKGALDDIEIVGIGGDRGAEIARRRINIVKSGGEPPGKIIAGRRRRRLRRRAGSDCQ